MPEYIERSDAADYFEKSKKTMWHKDDVVATLSGKSIPAADVAAVRRGWWAKKNVGFLKAEFCCSICGRWEHEYAYEHSDMNYCPNCGAKMDGKADG